MTHVKLNSSSAAASGAVEQSRPNQRNKKIIKYLKNKYINYT